MQLSVETLRAGAAQIEQDTRPAGSARYVYTPHPVAFNDTSDVQVRDLETYGPPPALEDENGRPSLDHDPPECEGGCPWQTERSGYATPDRTARYLVTVDRDGSRDPIR